MSGQRQDGVPIAAAAIALGMTAEGLRKRLNRGTLNGYKQDGAWFVVLPHQDAMSGQMAGRQDGTAGQAAGQPIEAAHQFTPAEVERAIGATAARYAADFAGLYDCISTEVGRLYEGQLAAKDETIATQRELIAHQAEILADARDRLAAERDALRHQAAPVPLSEAPTTLVVAEGC